MTLPLEKIPFVLEPLFQEPFYKHLYDCLSNEINPEEICQKLQFSSPSAAFDNPFLQIERYRKKLALHIVCSIKPELREHLEEFLNTEEMAWKEFQSITAFRALCEIVSGQSEDCAIDWVLSEQGVAPIEYGCHWKWASIPLQPYHVELGLLWALLGIATHREDLLSAAHRLAQFQLNLLDNDYLPLQGIFSHEKDAALSHLLGFSSTLFYYLGHALQKNEWIAVSRIQREFLKQYKLKVHPLLPLLERWKSFEDISIKVSKTLLPESFKDEALGFCARRSASLISIAALHGGRTSLGAYHVNKDLSIVAYGPQYLPYDDCQRFGIESGSYPQTIEEKEKGYLAKGIAKVMGKTIYTTPYAYSGNSCHSEIWLDVEQELSDDVCSLKIGTLSYEKENLLSFVFYIKAAECTMSELRTLKPKSLDRYRGRVESMTFTTSFKRIHLEPLFSEGILEVIPLAGDESFWGCDFLVGFTGEESSQTLRWKMTSSH